VSGEPAVMRAEMNEFDTFRQIQNRLRSLEITGHVIDKCDVRVIGGTWSVYPEAYREQVMIDIYDAHTLYAQLRESIVAEAFEDGNTAKYIGFHIPP
jgi:elongator complex protein 3